MAGISDVSYIAHFISQMHEITKHEIIRNKAAAIAQVGLIIYSGAAGIHTYKGSMQGNKFLLLPACCIIDP
jgi:hypothetical protein